MQHEIIIRESVPEDVHNLGLSMNDEDRAEAEALGLSAHKLLWRSYRASLIRKTIFVDGHIAAMFGCAGVIMGLVGIPWLCTAEIARTVPSITFARIYRAQVREMLRYFPYLENIADSRYTKSIKMLKICGFTVDEPQKHFGLDVLFSRYSLTA